jgi:sec-independent protein translocase protein TatB
MFDIGFTELLLLAVITLLVLGPERLPSAVRFAGLWLGRIRRSFAQLKSELEREMDSAELKQDQHNRSIMQQLDETQQDVGENLDQVRGSLKDLQYELAAHTPAETKAKSHVRGSEDTRPHEIGVFHAKLPNDKNPEPPQ